MKLSPALLLLGLLSSASAQEIKTQPGANGDSTGVLNKTLASQTLPAASKGGPAPTSSSTGGAAAATGSAQYLAPLIGAAAAMAML